ncbi:metal-dependent transcriptional regulator [Hippea alviniae]|uniref:metal-dependent transcriptional regulator n=1 Tax=Hippea alviniae TaxID=1279027 RepID=UPI0003B45234|nr:metal-dependent transcriptional regulator [Hippea alviniae]
MAQIKLTPSTEDYIKAIYRISQNSKVVRIKDVSKNLNVKMPSVVNAVKTLEEKGLVIHESYGYIELTPEGEKIGRELSYRYDTLVDFLVNVLQVDVRVAEEDACAIEHYLHPETTDRIVKFLSFLRLTPDGEPGWLRKFKLFLKTGKKDCDKLK